MGRIEVLDTCNMTLDLTGTTINVINVNKFVEDFINVKNMDLLINVVKVSLIVGCRWFFS